MSLVSVLPLLVFGLFLAIFHICDADMTLLHGHGVSSECCVQQDGTVETHVEVVASNGTDPLLKFCLTQTYNSPRNWNATKDFVQSVQVGSYTLGVEELYSFNITSTLGQDSTIIIHWGPAVEGSRVGTFYLQNGVVSGNIDGRSFLPFSLGNDNITVIFTDGRPSPILHPKSNTTALVQIIRDQLLKVYPQCVPPPPAAANSSITISPRQAPALDWAQNVAHSTNFNDAACFACKAAADTEAALGYAGCGFVCGSIFLSWECGNCMSAVTNTLNSAQAACQASTNCCKNRCGNIFSGCCGLGEVCFSPDVFNLCCDAGQQPCGVDLCCNQDQTCSAGYCCPTPQLCGNGGSLCCEADEACNSAGTACCPDCGGACCPGNVCLGGTTCCAQQDVCGSVCCPTGAGLLEPGNCVNPAESLCCYNSQIEVDGLCCNPGDVNCGGNCCSGNCVNNSCVLTSQNCLAQGGTGQTCTVEGQSCSSGFAVCQNGCCIEQPK